MPDSYFLSCPGSGLGAGAGRGNTWKLSESDIRFLLRGVDDCWRKQSTTKARAGRVKKFPAQLQIGICTTR